MKYFIMDSLKMTYDYPAKPEIMQKIKDKSPSFV